MHLPIAQSELSFWIYLIIGVFWVIGKMAEQKRARQKVEEMKRRREEREREIRRTGEPPASAPSPVPAPERPRSLEEELEEFLGRLAGEPPPPPPPAPPPPSPVVVFDPPPSPPPRQTPTYKTPTPRAVPPPPTPSTTILNEEAAAFAPVADIHDIEEVMHKEGLPDVASLINVRTLMVDMSRTTLRMPTVPTPRMSGSTTRTAKPDLRNASKLKDALIGSTLLEKPIALKSTI